MSQKTIPPIVGAMIYKNDVVIVRAPGKAAGKRGDRKEITEFSARSRQRLAFVACNTDATFRQMVCLTYPGEYSNDGQEVKRHLKAFLQWLRRYLNRGFSYLWFLEFQIRGAPHLHIVLDVPWPTSGSDVKSWRRLISRRWYDIVGSGDERHLRAGTSVEKIRKPDGAKRYAVKYSMKMRQKIVPPAYQNVGRFWGCSKDVLPTPKETIRVTEDDVRGALEGWPWAPNEHREIYSVLYRVADRFSSRSPGASDDPIKRGRAGPGVPDR